MLCYIRYWMVGYEYMSSSHFIQHQATSIQDHFVGSGNAYGYESFGKK